MENSKIMKDRKICFPLSFFVLFLHIVTTNILNIWKSFEDLEITNFFYILFISKYQQIWYLVSIDNLRNACR